MNEKYLLSPFGYVPIVGETMNIFRERELFGTKENRKCKYSDSCFTCPMPDCVQNGRMCTLVNKRIVR